MDKNVIDGKKLLADIMLTDLTTILFKNAEGWFVKCMKEQ